MKEISSIIEDLFQIEESQKIKITEHLSSKGLDGQGVEMILEALGVDAGQLFCTK